MRGAGVSRKGVAGVAQQALQPRRGGEGLCVGLEEFAERRWCVDAIDLGGERVGLLPQPRIREFRPVLTHARGVGRLGRPVDLHPQPLEGRIAIGDRSGHVPDLLRRCRVGAVRQEPDADPQCRKAIADPLFPRGHRREEVTRGLALVFFLYGPAVEPGLAKDPTVVGR